MIWKWACIGLLFLAVALNSASSMPQASDNLKAARSATFTVMLNGKSECTGFAIDHRLVTAGHCVSGLTAFDVLTAFSTESGATYKLKIEKFTDKWPSHDFAVLTFDGDAPPIYLSKTDRVPEVGDPVWSVTGPSGYSPMLVKGSYVGRVHKPSEPDAHENGMYGLSIMCEHGSSGSPVLDQSGKVWGILVGGNMAVPGLALVVLFEE